MGLRLHHLVCAALAGAAVPSSAWAWGATGHRITGELAIRLLPSDLPEFVRSEAAALRVGELAREPDRSRGAGSSHDPDSDPAHFIDVSDDLKIFGGPSLAALPATREAYDTALRAAGSDEYRAGYLPYAIVDGWQQLVKDFAYWRADVAAAKFAANAARRAWFERDRETREQLTIRDLGFWAHFVGDASQPMHVSVHYDGWGDVPNPDGFTTQKGVHAQFEGAFVRAHVSEDDVAALVPATAHNAGTIQARVSTYLLATQTQVEPFYRLEKAHAFAGDDAAGKAFAAARLAAAVTALRDMIADAWIASEDAKIGYPALAVKDIEAGKVDPFDPLRGED